MKKASKQTVITAHEFVVPGSWERQMAFSSHTCGDISILWAFAEIGGWDKEPENVWGSWDQGAKTRSMRACGAECWLLLPAQTPPCGTSLPVTCLHTGVVTPPSE